VIADLRQRSFQTQFRLSLLGSRRLDFWGARIVLMQALLNDNRADRKNPEDRALETAEGRLNVSHGYRVAKDR
jgi:hypothetical protein